MSEIESRVEEELSRTKGILFGEKTLVGRGSYKGNNFIANNSSVEDVDKRGYYLVERWILSIIQTENPSKIIGEGLTKMKNIGTLKEISDSCPEKVFGSYLKSW